MAEFYMSLTKEQEAVVQRVLGVASPIVQFVASLFAGGQAALEGGAGASVQPQAPAMMLYGMPYPGAPPPAVLAKYGLPLSCPKDNGIRTLYGIMPPANKPPNINALYGIPLTNDYGGVRIYFSDLQKQQMEKNGIPSCDYVDLSPAVMKYGIVVPVK